MGKGKRARIERAERKGNNPELFLAKSNKKKNKSFPTATVVFCAVLVFLVAILAWTLVKNSGVIGRSNVVAESNNLTVNENELAVYEFMATNEWSNQFYTEYFYYAYGLYQDTYGITKTYSSAEEYASAMISAYKKNGIIEMQAYEFAKEFLAFCEGALKNNYSFDNEEIAEHVDEYIASIAEQAASSQTSFNNYVSSSMGTGVSKKDIRTAMQKYFLAEHYKEDLNGQFSDAVTDAELNEYLDAHKSDFYTSEYHSYVLMDKEMKDYFAGLEGEAIPADATELKELIVEYVFNKEYAELYKTKFTDAKVEDADAEKTKADILETVKAESKLGTDYTIKFNANSEGDYNKVAYEVAKAIKTKVEAQLKNVAEDKTATYADPTATKATDLEKLLFGTDTVKGTVKVLEETTGTGDNAKTTYTYYIVKDVMVLDTECTKDGAYLLLKDDASTVENKKTAAEKADAFIAALGDPTVDKFVEVAKDYTESSVTYERIAKDSVDEALGEWLYAEERKANDIAKITVSTGVYVVIYQESNEMTWRMNARDGITAEKVDAWYQAALVEFNVEAHTEAPATTTATEAATTAPATEAATTAAATTVADTTAEEETTTEEETTADQTEAA